MTDPAPRLAGAFAAAALTPAALIGLYFLVAGIRAPGDAGFGPGLVLLAFVASLIAVFVAGLHIGLLAVPLYRLLSRRGVPGVITILFSSVLIGALPLPVLFKAQSLDTYALFGLLGLTGGVTFLLVAGLPEEG